MFDEIIILLIQFCLTIAPFIILFLFLIIIILVIIHVYSFYKNELLVNKYNKTDFSIITSGMTKKQVRKKIKLKPISKNEFVYVYGCIQKTNNGYVIKEKIIIFKNDIVAKLEESSQTSYANKSK